MSQTGAETIFFAMAWVVTIGIGLNLAFLFANLKIYTEIMKEKAQRGRGVPVANKEGQ